MAVTALTVIPLVLFGLLTIRTSAEEHESRIIADRVGLARAVAQTVDAFITGNLSTVSSLAVIPAVQGAARDDVPLELLARVAAENPEWEGLGLVGPDGTNVGGSQVGGGAFNVADRPYFQRVMATGLPTVSEPVLGRALGVIAIPVAAPVRFTNGERGVLVAPLSVQRFGAEMQELYRREGVQIAIVDREGRAFVHPDPARAQALAPLRGAPEVEAVLDGRTGGQRGPGPGGEESLITYAPIADLGWGVLIFEPAERAFAPVRNGLLRQLLLLFAAIAVVGAIAWHVGGRLAAFYLATVRARRLAEGARVEAERAVQRTSFLARMSQELASSLDYEPTLANVAHLAVPEIADWCAVDVVDEDGSIRRVAVAHADPAKKEVADELARRYPRGPGGAVPQVIRSGKPQLYSDVTDARLEANVQDPDLLGILRQLAMKSVMVVPMEVHDHVLGALTFVSSDAAVHYDEDDLAFAMAVATRAALAVENARLYRDLQRAVRSRDEYLAAASHDLRNPLTAVRGSAQLLSRQLRRMGIAEPEPVRASLDIIESATIRMGRLVNGLLDLARLEMGRPLELDRSRTDLAALVRQVVAETLQGDAAPLVRVQADAPVFGEWDAPRLERLVANLLDNAIRYSAGRGAVAVSVERKERDGRGYAVLMVQDEGVGIPPEDLPRVFDRFHRGSNVVGQIAGTGLGLSGARQIALEHGGDISLASNVGRGTTVRVELPTDPDAPASDGEPELQQAPLQPTDLGT
jgi:signal transduction histidine kinase